MLNLQFVRYQQTINGGNNMITRENDERLKNLAKRLTPYDDILYVKDVARLLEKTTKAIQKSIQSGKLKAIKNKGEYVIAKPWVIQFVKNSFDIPSKIDELAAIQKKRIDDVLLYCKKPRSVQELLVFTGLKDKPYLRSIITKPLLESGYLRLLFPDTPHIESQKYITVKKK